MHKKPSDIHLIAQASPAIKYAMSFEGDKLNPDIRQKIVELPYLLSTIVKESCPKKIFKTVIFPVP